MNDHATSWKDAFAGMLGGAVAFCCVSVADAAAAASAKAKFSTAVAFDVSRPAREIAPPSLLRRAATATDELRDIRPDRGPVAVDSGFTGDGGISGNTARLVALTAPALSGPIVTFEGLSNQDNFDCIL